MDTTDAIRPFTLTYSDGETVVGTVQRIKYIGGTAALRMMTKEGPYGILSVNLDRYGLEPSQDAIFIRVDSNLEDLAQQLVSAGLGTITRTVKVGPFSMVCHEVKLNF